MLSRDTVLPATTARVRERQRDARRVDEKQLHLLAVLSGKKKDSFHVESVPDSTCRHFCEKASEENARRGSSWYCMMG
jgi:hypothetical protein